jgi:hypothetical protein
VPQNQTALWLQQQLLPRLQHKRSMQQQMQQQQTLAWLVAQMVRQGISSLCCTAAVLPVEAQHWIMLLSMQQQQQQQGQ